MRATLALYRLRREDRQMPITEQLLYQTDQNSHRRSSIQKAACQNFAIFTGKHLATLLKGDSNTDVFL